MSEAKLRVERDAAIGRLVLSNPARRNAISGAMWQAIPAAVAEFEADAAIRCIVVRGEGEEAFAAGADISEFEARRSSERDVAQYDAQIEAAHVAIESCAKPVIAQIYGFCIGGGLAIALSCDLRYAASNSRFAIPAARLGLGYGARGINRLVATVGHANAREILFSARRYDAQEALAMGLVNRVLPDAELNRYVGELTRGLAENAPLTQTAAKTTINAIIASHGDFTEANRMIARCMQSEDYAEGRRAFMEKRAPQFRGK